MCRPVRDLPWSVTILICGLVGSGVIFGDACTVCVDELGTWVEGGTILYSSTC